MSLAPPEPSQLQQRDAVPCGHLSTQLRSFKFGHKPELSPLSHARAPLPPTVPQGGSPGCRQHRMRRSSIACARAASPVPALGKVMLRMAKDAPQLNPSSHAVGTCPALSEGIPGGANPSPASPSRQRGRAEALRSPLPHGSSPSRSGRSCLAPP